MAAISKSRCKWLWLHCMDSKGIVLMENKGQGYDEIQLRGIRDLTPLHVGVNPDA